MREYVSVLVQTKQSQERITAIIDLYLTNDPQAPLEIKIFSWDNMLLLFNSRITPYMIAEMCSKLLMANMKPDRLPYLLQKLIQTAVGTSRAFYLAAEDSQTFYLQVTDFCDDQQFPRFSLPVKRCDFEDVAKELYNHLRSYRQQVADLNTKISNSEQEFEAYHLDLIQQLKKQTQFSADVQEQLAYFKAAAESERYQLNSQILRLNQQLAVKEVESSGQQAYIGQLSYETSLQKHAIYELTEKLHYSQMEAYQSTYNYVQTSQQLSQVTEQFSALQTKHEAKLLYLKDAENQALALNQQLVYATSSLDCNQLRTQQELTELKNKIGEFQKENEDLKILAGKLASKVEDMTEKEQFYYAQMHYMSEQSYNAILGLYEMIGKNDTLQQENAFQAKQLSEQEKTLRETSERYQQALLQTATQAQYISSLEGENQALKRQLQQEKQRADDAEAQLGNRMYSKLMTRHNADLNAEQSYDRGSEQGRARDRASRSAYLPSGFAESSIMSEYRDLLQKSGQSTAQSTQQPTFKQFDMSRYLKDLALPKPTHQSAAESTRSFASQPSTTPQNAIQLSPSTKSSASEETKNIVNKYVKNYIAPKDLEMPVSSTSEDLLFRVMATVPKDPETERRSSKTSDISVEIARGEQPAQIKDDSQLRYYMDLLNEEIY